MNFNKTSIDFTRNPSSFSLGYGDKVPNSIIGKIVGMIWTMFGICIVSIFTASVTTIMGEVLGDAEVLLTITGNSVGVINGSLERHLVLQAGGNPVGILSCTSFKIILK